MYNHFQKKMRGEKNTLEVATLITKLDLILWPLVKFKASDFRSWRLKLPLRDKAERLLPQPFSDTQKLLLHTLTSTHLLKYYVLRRDRFSCLSSCLGQSLLLRQSAVKLLPPYCCAGMVTIGMVPLMLYSQVYTTQTHEIN